MDNTKIEVRVGLFTLFALILFVWAWAWLKSFSLFSQPQRFTAEFSDVAGLTKNAPVNVQGVRVGTVDAMEFVNNPNNPEQNRKIDVYCKITDPTVRVPLGSHISIQTLGLVGAKYVEIALPRDAAGNVIAARPLGPDDIVMPPYVQDPVRVELVMNKVATRVDDIVSGIDTKQASKTLTNLSQAAAKLNKNMDNFKDAAESIQTASANVSQTATKFGRTADSAQAASARASTFFVSGDQTMHGISELSEEFRGTTRKVNKLLDNPNFSSDLKETITKAQQTAETIRATVVELGSTLQDKDLRNQVLSSLTHLEKSTDNLRSSFEMVTKLSNDSSVRSDLKEIVQTARATVQQASALVNEPDFKTNIVSTLSQVKAAAINVDVSAKQLQDILGKRAPLLHMIFGQPGKIRPAQQSDDAVAPSAVKQPPMPQTPTPGTP